MKLSTKKTLEHGGVAVGGAVILAVITFVVNLIKGIFDKKIDAQTEKVDESITVIIEPVNEAKTEEAETEEAETVVDMTAETTEQ